MDTEEKKNIEAKNLIVPSIDETKRKELISLLAGLIKNYANKEIGKER